MCTPIHPPTHTNKLKAGSFRWICLLNVISVQFEAFTRVSTYILRQMHRTIASEAMTKLQFAAKVRQKNTNWILHSNCLMLASFLYAVFRCISRKNFTVLWIDENNVSERARCSSIFSCWFNSNAYSGASELHEKCAHKKIVCKHIVSERAVAMKRKWNDWMAGSLCGRMWLCKRRWFWAFKRTPHTVFRSVIVGFTRCN